MKRPASSLLLLPALLFGGTLRAGVGPETTLLVVNADSPLSLTVANHWMELRPIPQNHVVWLHDIPTLETLSMQAFRDRILEPVHQHMEMEGIRDDIDAIVYSADFPYAVDIRKELKRNGIRQHRYIGSAASLTGLTFFANQVLEGRTGYLNAWANDYYRREIPSLVAPDKPLDKKEENRRKEARKALKKKEADKALALLGPLLENHGNNPRLHLLMAKVLTSIGQYQAALNHLEKAWRTGWSNSLVLRNDKLLAPLRKTRGFQELMKRIDRPRARFEPPMGFRHRYHWSRAQLPGSTDQDRYRLSALLAYTGQRGNSLAEIDRYLSRSATSDAGHPRGTVYLMENGDVRTETRQPWFGETCALLRAIGHRCRILTRGVAGENGVLPKKRTDIIGLVAGTRTFDWKRSGSRLLPGAIAESLTSYAGDFDNGSQTKLTEFLRHGAAGSSGAVVEPYSFAEKFPLPLMHYYYSLGYSLAESWYMAVASPYQTILMGDPLARPFADPVELSLQSPQASSAWRGSVKVQVKIRQKEPGDLDHLELWLDGRLVSSAAIGEALSWDTTQAADGYHELHLVAVEKPPREGRTSWRHWIRVDNRGLSATLDAQRSSASHGTPFFLQGTAPPGSRISIRQGTRELLALQTTSGIWETILPTSPLGMGKVTLQAIAITPNGIEIHSNPLPLEVTQPMPWRPTVSGGAWRPGLQATLMYSTPQGDPHIRKETVKSLQKLGKHLEGKENLEGISISGAFLAGRSGFYQLSIRTRGRIEVQVDGQRFEKEADQKDFSMVFIPLFLQKGWHRLEIIPRPEALKKLQVVISGSEPPFVPGGKRLRSRDSVTKPGSGLGQQSRNGHIILNMQGHEPFENPARESEG